jgi:transposase-like protein
MNVIYQLPKKRWAEARELLTQIAYADTRAQCERRRDQFVARYGKAYPKAAATLCRDWERLVAFYNFPQEHWRHLRTSNPVESPFAALRLRTSAAKRFTKVASAEALIWKTLLIAEKKFRRLNAPELLKEVWEGKPFVDGVAVKKGNGVSRRLAA